MSNHKPNSLTYLELGCALLLVLGAVKFATLWHATSFASPSATVVFADGKIVTGTLGWGWNGKYRLTSSESPRSRLEFERADAKQISSPLPKESEFGIPWRLIVPPAMAILFGLLWLGPRFFWQGSRPIAQDS